MGKLDEVDPFLYGAGDDDDAMSPTLFVSVTSRIDVSFHSPLFSPSRWFRSCTPSLSINRY